MKEYDFFLDDQYALPDPPTDATAGHATVCHKIVEPDPSLKRCSAGQHAPWRLQQSLECPSHVVELNPVSRSPVIPPFCEQISLTNTPMTRLQPQAKQGGPVEMRDLCIGCIPDIPSGINQPPAEVCVLSGIR